MNAMYHTQKLRSHVDQPQHADLSLASALWDLIGDEFDQATRERIFVRAIWIGGTRQLACWHSRIVVSAAVLVAPLAIVAFLADTPQMFGLAAGALAVGFLGWSLWFQDWS